MPEPSPPWQDRDWLAAALAAGRSIESIAREFGRDSSTIAYWVQKYGLMSEHAGKHAARGGLDRDLLTALVAEGLTVRQIAARVDRSYATVRHWLRQYGLTTRRGPGRGDPTPSDDGVPRRMCPTHGVTEVALRPDGGWRCKRCRSEAVSKRRRKIKLELVRLAGGACTLCGYDRLPSALHFHHIDPDSKLFALAERGFTYALEKAREEAAKCVLLCANCHAEVEAGLVTISLADSPGR